MAGACRRFVRTALEEMHAFRLWQHTFESAETYARQRQHLAAMGAWFLYLMAHLVRRDRALTLPTTPRQRLWESDDNESDVDDDD